MAGRLGNATSPDAPARGGLSVCVVSAVLAGLFLGLMEVVAQLTSPERRVTGATSVLLFVG